MAEQLAKNYPDCVSGYCESLYLKQAVRIDMPRVCTFHILAKQTKQFPAAALHFSLHVSLLHQENQAQLPPQLLT